jgi:hypothetical protein
MRWFRWVLIFLALLGAGWMTFDGTRALIVGDYVTPKTGRYAGQLGPWAGVVSAAGIEPRSTFMKSVFAIYGTAWLVIIGFYISRHPLALWAMFFAAVGSLWYYPVGTASSMIQIMIIVLFAIKKEKVIEVMQAPVSAQLPPACVDDK